MIKTVLEMDLKGYSDVALILEENLDVAAVKAFQEQIQTFVDEGLLAIGLPRDNVVLGTAGDNAILVFEDANVMHRFAEVVHEATRRHNRARSLEAAKRWFRMGAATGTVLLEPAERRIVGTATARAVRLEAAAQVGQILIDTATYEALAPELRGCYSPVEAVRGKREEEFQVHRCTFVPAAEVGPSLLGLRKRGRRIGTLVAGAAACVVLAGLALWHYGGQPSAVGSSPPGLHGRLDVTLWRTDSPTQGARLETAGALPAHEGDQYRVTVALNEPAHVYLLMIWPTGEVDPLYPWAPGDWAQLASPDKPTKRISLPIQTDNGWTLPPLEGMVTLVLLARRAPLPEEFDMPSTFQGLPEIPKMNGRSLVWFDRDVLMSGDRSPKFFQPSQIEDPVLIRQRTLHARLDAYFDDWQSVIFATVKN